MTPAVYICAALAMTGEATDLPMMQAMVAQVIEHRSHTPGFPADVCRVVTQRNAFPGVLRAVTRNRRLESRSMSLLEGMREWPDLVAGAVFYHRDDVDPPWAHWRSLKLVLHSYGHKWYALASVGTQR